MALEAASAGLDLILVYRAADGLEQMYQEASDFGAKARVCPVNLTEFAAHEQILDAVSSAAGGPGATWLFRAAGASSREWTTDVTEQGWDQHVAVNQKLSWTSGERVREAGSPQAGRAVCTTAT